MIAIGSAVIAQKNHSEAADMHTTRLKSFLEITKINGSKPPYGSPVGTLL